LSSPAERPKKRLGQHFLKDPNTARIVAEGVSEDDVVLEVGPGRGFLTAFLAEKAKLVHAIEVDPDVLPGLRRAVSGYGNVLVYRADALSFDYGALEPAPNRLAANLPYNIASPLVLRLLEKVPSIGRMRFMVQLEVARRLAARPRSKDYGAYAVLVGLLARVEVVHKVPPGVFEPPPRVYSAVVDLQRKETPPEEYGRVKDLVTSSFSSRRKRLANNLPGEARRKAPAVLERLGHGPDARAEELAPEEFVALYRALAGDL
jgi:16S rRNA (adenine1518-N6/adenine1519-N6)-dimethyltransferase